MATEVTVRIPTALRAQTDQEGLVRVTGSCVGDVLSSLCSRFPSLGQRLFREGGQLNRFINVYLNDEDIRFLGQLGTPVSEGDEVSLLPAIAGG